MKIYTRTGDQGQTSLLFGQRVAKSDPRVEAYGTADEANSAIGLALALLPAEGAPGQPDLAPLKADLEQVQRTLFDVGAELATPPGRRPGWEAQQAHVEALEAAIDRMETQLAPLTSFLLPGGSPGAAALHVARCVVRRAERIAVDVQAAGPLNPVVVTYLNRLSDFLFVAARYANAACGTPELAGPVPQGLRPRP